MSNKIIDIWHSNGFWDKEMEESLLNMEQKW